MGLWGPRGRLIEHLARCLTLVSLVISHMDVVFIVTQEWARRRTFQKIAQPVEGVGPPCPHASPGTRVASVFTEQQAGRVGSSRPCLQSC